MSWHYLQGLEEVYLQASSLDGTPFARLSSTNTADVCYYKDNAMGSCHDSRYGMTSARSTVNRGVEQLTLFPAGFPVKTSAARVKEQGLPETVAGYGSRCYALFERFGLRMSSQRIVRICGLADLLPLSKDLPSWGMTHDGVCWGLGTSVRHIDAIECGSLLPTPTGANNETSPSMMKWRANRNMLPTLSATLYGTNRGGAAGRVGQERPSLERLLGGIKLSIREWMMGWPIGWTALEPLEMDKFQQWRQWLGKYFQERSREHATS
jgi:hypothetical protein